MRRSTVLSLPLQLVFPGLPHSRDQKLKGRAVMTFEKNLAKTGFKAINFIF